MLECLARRVLRLEHVVVSLFELESGRSEVGRLVIGCVYESERNSHRHWNIILKTIDRNKIRNFPAIAIEVEKGQFYNSGSLSQNISPSQVDPGPP